MGEERKIGESNAGFEAAEKPFDYPQQDAGSRLTFRLHNPPTPDPCSVCGGAPLASGRPCICGGVGTAAAETAGLRRYALALEGKLQEARKPDLAMLLAFEAGREDADALNERERAALAALLEWREADREMSEYDHQLAVFVMCHERVGLEESRRLAQLKAVEFGKRNALRAAADKLRGEPNP